MNSRVTAIVSSVAALASITALASCNSPQSTGSDGPVVLGASGSSRWPSTSASDWATYADHVVVIEPEAEEPVPLTPDEQEIGEGLTFRRVSLRVDGGRLVK